MSHSRAKRRRPRVRFLTRSLAIFLVLATMGGGTAYRYFTDPVTVRRIVLDGLRKQFPGAEVSLDSARLWPGWGIQISNLTLSRKDDSTLMPVLQVPTGRIEHDSAALAEGHLRIKRIKLDRPRLTAACDGDGRWNLEGLLAPPRPDLLVPIIVVERATLILRLTPSTGGESTWEINNIRASIMEETHGVPARFEGRGESRRLGRLQIEGALQRQTGVVDASFDCIAIPVRNDLLLEFARFLPLPLDHIRHVSGTGNIHLTAHRPADPSVKWQTEWRLGINGGALGLRELPLDLTDIELTALVQDGRLTVPEAHARAADAAIRGKLEAMLPAADPAQAVTSAAVAIDHLLVTPEFFARLPESAKRLQQRFAPVGHMSLVYQFARRSSGQWDARFETRPEDIAARYHKFPYPLRKMTGVVISELSSDQSDRHSVDVSAEVNGGSRFTLRGSIKGDEPHPEADLWITGADGRTAASDIPVDDDLIAALPPRFQPIARSFHYQGRCDVFGRIHHAAGSPRIHDQYHVQCKNASVCYDLFPVPLEQVNAELEFHLGQGMPGDPNRGDYWVVRSANAIHKSAQIGITARSLESEYGQQIIVESTGIKMPIDNALAKALEVYKLGPTWEMMAPSGTFDYSARLVLTDRREGGKDPAVTLAVQGATIKPGFFPFELSDVAAHLHAEPGRVVFGECSGRHGPSRLRLTSGEIRTNHGFWADMRDIRATPLSPDLDLIRALPPTLQKAGLSLQPHGDMDVHVKRLVLHDPPAVPGPPGPPILHWDGVVAVKQFGWTTGVEWKDMSGTWACRGSVKGNRLDWLIGHAALDTATIIQQPLRQLHAQLQVDTDSPDVLQVRGLRGQLFGGDVAGEARINFGGGLDYALDIKALGVQLEDFGPHNHIGAGKLEGRASGQLYLTGRGTGLDEVTGRGEIDLPTGQLYDMPLVLELFKAITLRAPDGIAFDEAHAQFKIDGRRLTVQRLDLLGNAVSLGGRGALNLDGSDVDLDFYAVWGRIAQVLPVGWRDVPPWLSRQLLKIKMRGSLGEPTFAPEPVPFIVEPVQLLMNRVMSRQSSVRKQKAEPGA